MSKSKVKYKHLCQFDRIFRQLKEEEKTFELRRTQYSKEIRVDNTKIFFNNTGKNDLSSLGLIMKVRSDGNKFINNPEWKDVSHIDFFNMINVPQLDDVLSKVDIKGAYWNYALMSGVISEETNKYLNERYKGHSYKYIKGIKLKSLGSLATRKKIIHYIKGKPDWDNEKIISQPTRNIYMNICNGIDEIMKKASKEIEGCVYYYWDCIFLKKQFEKQAVEFFRDHKYEVGLGQTRLEYVKIGNYGYLITHDSKKPIMYMTKKEKRRNKPEVKSLAEVFTPDIVNREYVMS